MSEVVISGTFADKLRLRSVMDALSKRGIQNSRMSFVQTKGTQGEAFHLKLRSKATHGFSGGLLLGALIGAIISLLSLKVSFFVGDFQMAGAYASAFFGAAIGGWAGGLIGWLAGRKVPSYEAHLTSDASEADSILLGVVVEEEQEEEQHLTEFLKKHGASNVAKLDRKYATEVGL